MENQLLLNVAIREESEGGFSVVCTDLGVASQGESIDEAIENIKEAIELYLESAQELKILDDILDKLGLTREDLKKKVIVPRLLKMEVPVKIAA